MNPASYQKLIYLGLERNLVRRKAWLNESCHNLKYDKNGAKVLLREIEEKRKNMPIGSSMTETA